MCYILCTVYNIFIEPNESYASDSLRYLGKVIHFNTMVFYLKCFINNLFKHYIYSNKNSIFLYLIIY